MPSARSIVVEIIGDEKSYLRSVGRTLVANAKLESSSNTMAAELGRAYDKIGVDANLSADAQLKAAAKASEAMKAQALAMRAGVGRLPLEQQAAGAVAADAAMAKYNRSIGVTAASTRGLSSASKAGERDLGKMVRGTLAGSGAVAGLGRSMAFASGGFLAFAVGATVITRSITSAETLAKAQESLGVAIKHTGGNLAALLPRYAATAKAAAQFGISQADATTGLARATELTGNAERAQHAYEEALVISKATGKDFNAVLTATAKGQEGVTTSLRRYGILIPKGERGTAQLAQVMQRFGGQAAANTTAMDKLHAAFANAEATIGTALLPTFNHLATSLGDWLTKMNNSGRLQKDVNDGLKVTKDLLGPVAKGFENLANAVGDAKSAYQGFKEFAKPPSWLHLGGSGGGGIMGLIKSGLQSNIYTGGFYRFLQALHDNPPGQGGVDAAAIARAAIAQERHPWAGLPYAGSRPAAPGQGRITAVTSSIPEQVAQAQAGLTRGTADDVAAARKMIARIKALIAGGHLSSKALVQALGLEASALSTIWSAEDTAAQKRAAATQAAAARIQAQIQDSIDPLRLEVALSRAQALGKPILATLRKLRGAARAALASGKLSLDQQKTAWDQITSLNQQIAAELKKHKNKLNAAANAFKQASTRELTAGLDLTDAQRKALRARLSQLGPHGTVPGSGVGAFGDIIGPHGRPIHVHSNLYIDGKKVAQSTTRHQQRHRSRNSSQRRGPNAGVAGG